jgi:MoxR-like ATPase
MTSVTPPATEAAVADLLARVTRLRTEVAKVIVGQEEIVEQLLLSLLAGGHALLEGVPGLAKTLMIRTLSDALALDFRRIQFTPDLMPTDIVGTELLEEEHGTGKKAFKFAKGPIFANIVLADEINRTPPKTQAALLEAMQEGSVTYAGTTYQLPRPFFVLATQNPIEQAGTYPLPEAQLDRFLVFIRVGYPTEQEEIGILARTTGTKSAKAEAVLGGEELRAAQALVRQVHVSDDLLTYAARLVRATRPADSPVAAVKEQVRWGAGPRAGQALILAAKARALLLQRFAVTLDDMRAVAAPVLRHRVLVSFRAEADGITPDDVVTALLQHVPAPRGTLS